MAAKPLLTTRVKIQTLCLTLVWLSASFPEREISMSISDYVKTWLALSGPILHPQPLLSLLSLPKSPQSPLVQALCHSSEGIAAMESSHLISVILSAKFSPKIAEEREKILQSSEEREARKKDEMVPIKSFLNFFCKDFSESSLVLDFVPSTPSGSAVAASCSPSRAYSLNTSVLWNQPKSANSCLML